MSYIQVEIQIENIHTQDLIDELNDRGYTVYEHDPFEMDDDFLKLYEMRVRNEDVMPLIDKLLYNFTGRIVP